jgi:hypothetical protein
MKIGSNTKGLRLSKIRVLDLAFPSASTSIKNQISFLQIGPGVCASLARVIDFEQSPCTLTAPNLGDMYTEERPRCMGTLKFSRPPPNPRTVDWALLFAFPFSLPSPRTFERRWSKLRLKAFCRRCPPHTVAMCMYHLRTPPVVPRCWLNISTRYQPMHHPMQGLRPHFSCMVDFCLSICYLALLAPRAPSTPS